METEKQTGNEEAQPQEAASRASGKRGQIAAFVIVALIAVVLFAWMLRQEVPAPSAGPEEEEEEVTEEVRALRAGEGAMADEEFAPGFCEGTFTHEPVGYSFTCPEGWYRPYASAHPDRGAPEHYVYEAAFASAEIEDPLMLGDDGIWIAADVLTRLDACGVALEEREETEPVTVDGEESRIEDAALTNPQTGEVLFSGKRVAVVHAGLCYQLSMFHVGGDDFSEKEQAQFMSLIEGFSFNR